MTIFFKEKTLSITITLNILYKILQFPKRKEGECVAWVRAKVGIFKRFDLPKNV
jgi:hypothetical protein